MIKIHNPSELPNIEKISKVFEPIITATILLPDEYLGPVDSTMYRQTRSSKRIFHLCW